MQGNILFMPSDFVRKNPFVTKTDTNAYVVIDKLRCLSVTTERKPTMYNDKNLQAERRQAMQRRNLAASARAEVNEMLPSIDDNTGGRLCDGTMPGQRSDLKYDHNADRDMAGWGLHGYPAAMVYSPYQVFHEVYTPDTALSRGTLFAELDLPFEGYKKGGC